MQILAEIVRGWAHEITDILCYAGTDFWARAGDEVQSTSGSWVTMWMSTAGDSRRKRWTTLR
jgi:hypothetical protein